MTPDAGSVSPVRVLAIESDMDEPDAIHAQLALPEESAPTVTTVTDVAGARDHLSNRHVDCVVCRHDPPAVDGVEILAAIREIDPDLPVLFATETDAAAEVIHHGPTDVIRLADGRFHRDIVRNRIASIVDQATQRGKYQQIFEQATDGIIVHDPASGDIREVNQRFRDIFQLSRSAAETVSLADIVAGTEDYSEARARDLVRSVPDSGATTVEFLFERGDGTRFWAEVRFTSARVGGTAVVLAFVRDISERKERERLVRDRDQQLEAVFDHPLALAVVIDESGRVIRANTHAAAVVGADAADLAGTHLWESPWAQPGSRTARELREAVGRAMEGAPPRIEVELGPAEDGRTFDIRLEPITHDDGTVASIVAAGFDVTERLRTEAALRSSRDTFQRLHEITASPDRSFAAQVSALLSLGAERLDMDIGFLSRIDREAGRFELVDARGDHPLLQAGAETDLAATYCRRTIADDIESPLAIENAAASMGDDPAYKRFGLGCYLGAEIVVDGDLFGTLCFADDEPRSREFTAEDRQLIDLMTAWLRQELAQREIRRDLEAARDRLSDTLERIDDAFVAVDDDWRLTFVNEAGAQLLEEASPDGHPADGFVGESIWELVPGLAGTTFEDHYRRAMDTQETLTFEAHYEALDIWYEVRVYPDPDGLSIYFTDVTARHERDRTLNDLLAVTREFIGAESRPALADRLLEGVDTVFDVEISSVRLHDAATGTLPPTRLSAASADYLASPPTYDDAEGPPGEAFQTGEPVIVDDLTAATEYDYGPIESAVFLPLGSHGILGLGALAPEAFDSADVALLELLTLGATGALDRLDTETEMRALNRIIEQVDQKVFLLDEAGRFTYVTPQLADYLDRDRQALQGTHLRDVLAARSVADCEAAIASARTPTEAGSVTLEVTIDAAAGDARPVELELAPTDEGSATTDIAGVVTDISELARTRSDLASERERFAELFENLPDPVAEVEFVDGDPLIRYVNPAFARTFGVDRESIGGANLNERIVPPGERSAAEDLDRESLAGDRTTVEVQRQTTSGERDFLLRGISHERAASTYGFAIYTDITDQKERGRYLELLNRVLRHNVRNDMNVVLALARRLQETVEDEDLAAQAGTLYDNAAAVTALSEKIRDIEQVLGRRGRETGEVDLVPQLREVVEVARAEHPAADIRLELPQELRVVGSPELKRAFAELLDNAVEHAEEETPAVRIEVVETAVPADYVGIRFADDGPGIRDAEWDVITGDAEITQLSHGSGLGLWLTRWIVESVGGELRRVEDADAGTTLELRFRRPAPPAED